MPSAKKPTASPFVNKVASISDSAVPPSVTIGPGQQFYMAMPYPGTSGTPFFDRRNVTDFLDRFLDLYGDYKLTNDKKMKRLPKYCNIWIRQTIETMKEWKK